MHFTAAAKPVHECLALGRFPMWHVIEQRNAETGRGGDGGWKQFVRELFEVGVGTYQAFRIGQEHLRWRTPLRWINFLAIIQVSAPLQPPSIVLIFDINIELQPTRGSR